MREHQGSTGEHQSKYSVLFSLFSVNSLSFSAPQPTIHGPSVRVKNEIVIDSYYLLSAK